MVQFSSFLARVEDLTTWVVIMSLASIRWALVGNCLLRCLAVQSKGMGSAADEFVRLTVNAHANRRRHSLTTADSERSARQSQIERMPAVADSHSEALHLPRQFWVEPQNIT